jgi:hypothetical protein
VLQERTAECLPPEHKGRRNAWTWEGAGLPGVDNFNPVKSGWAGGCRPPLTSISTPKNVYHWRNQEKEKLEVKADQEEQATTVSDAGRRPEQSIMAGGVAVVRSRSS